MESTPRGSAKRESQTTPEDRQLRHLAKLRQCREGSLGDRLADLLPGTSGCASLLCLLEPQGTPGQSRSIWPSRVQAGSMNSISAFVIGNTETEPWRPSFTGPAGRKKLNLCFRVREHRDRAVASVLYGSAGSMTYHYSFTAFV